MFASYRDPRDVALSLLDHGARSRQSGIEDFAKFRTIGDTIEAIRSEIRKFENWVRLCGPIIIPYDEICFDTRTTVEKIAQRLGLSVNIDAISQQFLANKRLIGQFNRGEPQRFKREMDPETSDQFVCLFSEYYAKYFPRELAATAPQVAQKTAAGVLADRLTTAKGEDATPATDRRRRADLLTAERVGETSVSITEDAAAVIGSLYQTILGRNPDPKGLSAYVDGFKRGKASKRSRNISGRHQKQRAGKFISAKSLKHQAGWIKISSGRRSLMRYHPAHALNLPNNMPPFFAGIS